MNPPPQQKDDTQRTLGRASFQAPTRASLARSQPEIVQRAFSNLSTRSLQRSTKQGSHSKPQNQTETGAFGLRDRKALRLSLASDASLTLDKSSPSRRSSGLQAFAAPPRRVSRRILPSDLSFQSPRVAQGIRQGNGPSDSPEDQLASELSNVPGEADSLKNLDQSTLHEGLGEPDLPPTPTELGLERPPARPRGLLSSSPSTQRESWGKRRTTDYLEQSPSKLRSVYHGEGKEDLSNSGLSMGRALFSEPVLKRRRLKRQLSTDIKQLQDDIAELENLSKSSSHHTDYTGWNMNKLVSILAEEPSQISSTKPLSRDVHMSSLISTLLPFSRKSLRLTPEEPLQVNPFSLNELSQTKTYSTVFAPLNLEANSKTYCGPEPGVHLERHVLKLSAPSPFPSRLLDISINCETNSETQSILSISVPLDSERQVPVYLRQWIDSRLASPLLKLDLAGLCWGINRYWEAAISRAKLWSRLEDQFRELIINRGNTAEPGDHQAFNVPILKTLSLRRILPHLERTSMLFEYRSVDPLRVYLSCELTLDEWASEPQIVPEISISAPSKSDGSSGRKVEQDAKRLFHSILSENQSGRTSTDIEINADTIVQATQCILGALFGVDCDTHVSEGRTKR
ncbi:hypothetical protein BDV28DRAFT_150689 [Aspergillus coremiiformis]|uniref:Uncharacterized protein n=1 Tax=Aspergillus coremiiformis TaxID=138285 RepID=A0A5N6YZ64_9EURO|nr:hypothetical protein BDV28DRAFT_150689 [Aspergillus coremiiformis]